LARKILLADDSVTAQNMGRKILADAGYEVIAVNNGSAALKKISEIKPDLVILDVYMPGYSGLEVCQRLKESQDSARIPVLLTVGKLEPFKPEEAQRVHAEGFIVKPFEASELLSALSKLEDKVVPRAEPSKPGRFARAIAAAEETSRGTRNEATGDDNGWKSRINFPHHKAEPEEKVADEAAIYNAVNRDLRTVVETPAELAAERAAEQEEKRHHAEKAADTTVDMAALVPPGLPRDVTPEEVAAIAAAAAQMQMLGAANKVEPADAAGRSSLEPPPVRAEESARAQAHAPVDSAPAVNAEPTPDTVPASKAETETERTERKIESPAAEAPSIPTDHRRTEDEKSEESQDEPVTMAGTAESMVAAHHGSSRWSAVAVALEAEESSIALDQEMQKAYAAFVAEETTQAAATVPELEAVPQLSSAPPELPVALVSNPEPEPQPAVSIQSSAAEPEPVAPPEAAAVASFTPAEPVSIPEPAVASIPQPEPAYSASVSPDTVSEEAHPEPLPAVEFASPAAADEVESPAPQELPPAAEAEAAMPEAAATSRHAFAPIARTEQPEEPAEESDAVKSTAAAWASWRQIRDTGEGKNTPEPSHEESNRPVPEPADSAAMAVAAGAEQAAQEAAAPPPENPGDVASIVDSVLADLRPRLMAEISRKMSEKK
jgi:two-component system, OmpR family, phosphate regulon response regulator PhoB